jgi:hypothetical protein
VKAYPTQVDKDEEIHKDQLRQQNDSGFAIDKYALAFSILPTRVAYIEGIFENGVRATFYSWKRERGGCRRIESC